MDLPRSCASMAGSSAPGESLGTTPASAAAEYSFRQRFRVPASAAFRWCIDFIPYDWASSGGHGSRKVVWFSKRTVVLDDEFPAPNGRRIRKVKLVQISSGGQALGQHPHRRAEPLLAVPLHDSPRWSEGLLPPLRGPGPSVGRGPPLVSGESETQPATSDRGRRALEAVRSRVGTRPRITLARFTARTLEPSPSSRRPR